MGRIVYTQKALPAVEPVRFVLDAHQIVAAVSLGHALPAAIHQSIVAFQADEFGEGREHWAVTVVGNAETLNDPAEIAKFSTIGLRSWTAGGRDQFVHIKPGIVTGQRWILLAGYRRFVAGTRQVRVVPVPEGPGPSLNSPPSFSARV